MDNSSKKHKRSKRSNSDSDSSKDEEEDYIHNQNCSSAVLNQIMKSLANLQLELNDMRKKNLSNLEQELHDIKTCLNDNNKHKYRSQWHQFVKDKQQDQNMQQWFKDNNIKPPERLQHIAKLWKEKKEIESL